MSLGQNLKTIFFTGLFIFFGLSLAANVGLFYWNQTIQSELTSVKNELTQLKEAQTSENNSKPSEPGLAGVLTESEIKFTDLYNSIYPNEIKMIARFSVVDGTQEQFRPLENISRGEFARWLVLAQNVVNSPGDDIRLSSATSSSFKDVSLTDPNFKYIEALVDSGYVVGYADGNFKPDQIITREEALAIMIQVTKKEALNAKPKGKFTNCKLKDYDLIDKRYLGYIDYDCDWADSVMGRIWGQAQLLRPKNLLTREEAAKAVYSVNLSRKFESLLDGHCPDCFTENH